MMSASQLAAVKALYGSLDRLTSQLENLGKSLPAARAQLKADAPRLTRAARKPPTLPAADWATALTLTEPAWAQPLRAKVAAVIASADSLAPKRVAVLNGVAPLLTAVKLFEAGSDYDSYKRRAQTVAATSLPAFHQAAQSFMALQTDSELKSRLGFEAGLPFLQNTRACKAVEHGAEYAEQLIAGIHKLP